MHGASHAVAAPGHSLGKTATNGVTENMDLVPYTSKDLQVISFTLQNEKVYKPRQVNSVTSLKGEIPTLPLKE